MVSIAAGPLHSQDNDLDLKCFPDLYPYGKYGQHERRVVAFTIFT